MIPPLKKEFEKNRTSPDPKARTRWIMGQLRPYALGNISLNRLSQKLKEISDE
jgi:hypothetical protein